MKPLVFLMAALVAAAGFATSAQAKGKDKDKGKVSWSVHVGMSQGRLGAQVTDMTEELRDFFGAPKSAGILVSKVVVDSPAAKAGVKVGDVIVEVAGKPIEQSWDVMEAVAGKHKGDKISVVVVRKKRRVKLSATLDDDGFGFGWGKAIRVGKGGHFDLDLDNLGHFDLDLDNLGHFDLDLDDLDNLDNFDFDDLAKMKGWPGSWTSGGDDDDDDELRKELKQTRKRLRDLEKRLKKLEKK